MHNRVSVLQTTIGILHRLKTTCTLVHKRLKIWGVFYPPSVIHALYLIAILHRQRSAKETQPNFAKRRTANRANNVPSKSRSHPSQKNWADFIHLSVRFFDDFEI